MERMVVLSREDVLSLDSLPEQVADYSDQDKPHLHLPLEGVDFEELEMDFIRQALERTNGNRTRAAELLGLTRSALLYRMQKFDLK